MLVDDCFTIPYRKNSSQVFVSPLLSLETFFFFSLLFVKVSESSSQKLSWRTSSFSTVLTGAKEFFCIFDDYICCSFRFFIILNDTRNLSFLFMKGNFNKIRLSHTRHLILLFFLFFLYSMPCRVSFKSLNTSKLFSISKVMFSIVSNNSWHSDGILDLKSWSPTL